MLAIKTSDGSHTLRSDRYGETYHSIHGAVMEARHIYLQASGIQERLISGQHADVLEIGFGLGLNCLLTADLACQSAATLNFHSIEHDILPPEILADLGHEQLLNNPGIARRLIEGLQNDQHRQSVPGLNAPVSICLAEERISLFLYRGDATSLGILPSGPFHAIYLDAFSPDTNPECWTPNFVKILFDRLAPGGLLTTYSAKGDVRRALLQSGFQVRKIAGPPGKREFLAAQSPL